MCPFKRDGPHSVLINLSYCLNAIRKMAYYEFSLLDILPYFYVLIFLVYLTYNKKIIGREILMFWILFIFSAIRYGIGYDYFNYCNIIENGGNLEPLSNLFIECARFLSCNQVFFILNSFCVIFPIYYVSKYNSLDPCLSMLTYYLFPILFLESLGIVRNASAYSAIFLSYHFLVRRNYLVSIICIVGAGLFHDSGYIGFILLIVYLVPMNRKVCIGLFCIAFISSDYIATFIQDFEYDEKSVLLLKMLSYIERSEQQGQFMKYIIILLNILNLFYWNKLRQGNSEYENLLKLVNCGACIWVLFSFDRTLSLRLSSYFLIFQILLMPLYYLNFNIKYRKCLRFLIIFFFSVYFSSGFIINIHNYKIPAKMNYIPYQTIFYHEKYINYKAAN